MEVNKIFCLDKCGCSLHGGIMLLLEWCDTGIRFCSIGLGKVSCGNPGIEYDIHRTLLDMNMNLNVNKLGNDSQ